MIDKSKLLEFIDAEIEACEIVKTPDDRAIIWELKRLKKRIELGKFDLERSDKPE